MRVRQWLYRYAVVMLMTSWLIFVQVIGIIWILYPVPTAALALPAHLPLVTSVPSASRVRVQESAIYRPHVPHVPIAPTAPLPVPMPALDRIVIPAIGLDSLVERSERTATGEWDVPDQVVGHHAGSGQPGDGSKIILSGHVAMPPAYVFARLPDMRVNDLIYLSRGQHHTFAYRVQSLEYIDIYNVPVAQIDQAAARVFAPSADESLVLITCYPATGWNAFRQRLIVWATPVPEDSLGGLQ